MTKPAPEQFAGFTSPYFTQVPDEVIDNLMATLSGSEFKVLMYIVRRTFGFNKKTDDISLKQICEGIVRREGDRLDHGTGLSKSTAVAAIKVLVERGIILTARNTDIEQGDQPTTYRLRFMTDKDRTPVSENPTGGISKTPATRVRKSNTQETVLQNTVNNRVDSSISKDLDPIKDRAALLANRYERPKPPRNPELLKDPTVAKAWLDVQATWDKRWEKLKGRV